MRTPRTIAAHVPRAAGGILDATRTPSPIRPSASASVQRHLRRRRSRMAAARCPPRHPARAPAPLRGATEGPARLGVMSTTSRESSSPSRMHEGAARLPLAARARAAPRGRGRAPAHARSRASPRTPRRAASPSGSPPRPEATRPPARTGRSRPPARWARRRPPAPARHLRRQRCRCAADRHWDAAARFPRGRSPRRRSRAESCDSSSTGAPSMPSRSATRSALSVIPGASSCSHRYEMFIWKKASRVDMWASSVTAKAS